MTSRSGPDMVVTSTPALDSVPRTPLSLLVVDDSIASRGHTAQLLQTHWGAGRTARCRFSLWLLTAHPPNPSWALCIRSCLSVYPCAEKDSQKEEGRGGGGREGEGEGMGERRGEEREERRGGGREGEGEPLSKNLNKEANLLIAVTTAGRYQNSN